MKFKRYKPYQKYKDSKVEWLGEIPEHWNVVSFKRLGYFQAGAGFPDEEQGLSDQELPFYKVSDTNLQGNEVWMNVENNTVSRKIATKLRAFVLPPETIIFAKVGAALLLNKRRILSKPACIDNNMMGFIRTCCELKWIFYWMCGLDLGRLANPGAVPSINENQIKEIVVPVPVVEEQREIGRFLDRETAKIDALIEKKERLIELLQEKRTALITHAVTKGLDPNVPMKDSGVEWIGEIPEHWDLIPLKFITAAKKGSVKTGPFGSQLLTSEMMSEEIKVYNQRNVIDRNFTEGENYVTHVSVLHNLI